MNSILHAPAFVIHLPRSTDRVDFFTKNIEGAGFTDMRIFQGVDGRSVNDRADAMLMFNAPPIDRELSYGQIGCLFSHLKVLKTIIDNNISIATVFEDDVHFHPEWKILSEKYWELTPKDFDILFIGNGLDSCREISDISRIQEITTESAWCTHGYIVTRAGAEKVLNSLLNWNFREFNHGSRGNTLSGLYAIDIMLVHLEYSAISGKTVKPFIWYSWNGTKYPCGFNTLPTKGNDGRNTGLVFQNADNFRSLVAEDDGDEVHNTFYEENGNILDLSNYELTEQWIADTFISPDATVLELGGRLGVVSVHINKRLTDTRRHCVIEPDTQVFKQMFRNIVAHNLNPQVFNGTITRRPQFFESQGLASRTRDVPCSCESFVVPNKTLEKLIEETGLKFDTLVADCEGCLEGFIDENIDYLDNFKMITYEEDCHSHCDYDKIKRIFAEHHFICIRPGGHSVWERQPPAPAPTPAPTPVPVSVPARSPPLRKSFVWNRR
jgi:FkbM family methyltransferase